MNEEAASSTARSMSAVEMPSKTLRTVSRAISSTSISPPLPDWSKPCAHSWIACWISEMSNSTERPSRLTTVSLPSSERSATCSLRSSRAFWCSARYRM